MVPYSLAIPQPQMLAPRERPELPAFSPEWWVYELEQELDSRWPLIQLYEDYYEGRHKLSFATAEYRLAFAQMLAAVSDNWIPMILQAWVERLRPQGFIFPTGDDDDEREGDKDAQRIWQDNNLDADIAMGFLEAGKHAESYMLIWPDDRPTPGIFGRFFQRRSQVRPRITLEHPSQVVVRREAGDRRRRAAALKKWQEDDGTIRANLYLPDTIHRYRRGGGADAAWALESDDRHNLGVVPVVPLVNEPSMLPALPPTSVLALPHAVPPVPIGLGRSDIADMVSTVDQLNKLLSDMLVASEFAGFRQRYTIGVEAPIDPETGEPVEAWKAGIKRVMQFSGDTSDVKVGEFSHTPLDNYWKAYESRTKSLAARTRTPPHYMLGEITNASGDALKSAETGLSSKADGKKTGFEDPIEEAMRIAFAWQRDKRAGITDAEVSWAPTEARSESEFVDSLVKKMSLGVPLEQLWSDAGYSPAQIARFRTMLREQGEREGVPEPPDPDADPDPDE